jgi:AraC-like DNA-binding protein
MFYQSYIPGPPLDELIECFWCLSDAPPHARERILPCGTLELVINLAEDEFRIYDPQGACRRFSGAMVSGAYRRSFVIDTREHASVIGVHFRPGGAAPFVGAPAAAIADAHVDLDALWGRRAGELRERLCDASSPAERFGVLERALRGRFQPPTRRHGAVRIALEHLDRSGEGIGELAARVGLSHRRLIEVFAAEIGMTPKLYGRVQRFQRALGLSRRAPVADWARLAQASGYCDQSHLIRDFIEFSGFSPLELDGHRGDRVKEHHVALGTT